MSVLKSRRHESKAQYIANARLIFIETIAYMTKLSARYGRLLDKIVVENAGELVRNVEIANSIYPSNVERTQLREKYLLIARGYVAALDSMLGNVYELLMNNPQGCFSKLNMSPNEAKIKIARMSQSLGEKLDAEYSMITGLIKSDKQRCKTTMQRESLDEDITIDATSTSNEI